MGNNVVQTLRACMAPCNLRKQAGSADHWLSQNPPKLVGNGQVMWAGPGRNKKNKERKLLGSVTPLPKQSTGRSAVLYWAAERQLPLVDYQPPSSFFGGGGEGGGMPHSSDKTLPIGRCRMQTLSGFQWMYADTTPNRRCGALAR